MYVGKSFVCRLVLSTDAGTLLTDNNVDALWNTLWDNFCCLFRMRQQLGEGGPLLFVDEDPFVQMKNAKHTNNRRNERYFFWISPNPNVFICAKCYATYQVPTQNSNATSTLIGEAKDKQLFETKSYDEAYLLNQMHNLSPSLVGWALALLADVLILRHAVASGALKITSE